MGSMFFSTYPHRASRQVFRNQSSSSSDYWIRWTPSSSMAPVPYFSPR